MRALCEIRKRIAGSLGHDVLSVTQKGLRVKDIESNDGQLSMDYSKYQLVEAGDLVMNGMDLLTGWVDMATAPGVTSPDYRVFSIRNGEAVDRRYLLRVLQMGYQRRIWFAFGQGSSHLGRWRLPTDAFNSLQVPLPPLHEQSAIASFLDRETAKIDALVAEQERLIELLHEKREHVITVSVTKGLGDPTPWQQSGLDWIGATPRHWRQGRLKDAVQSVKGGVWGADPCGGDGDVVCVRVADFDRLRFKVNSTASTVRHVSESERQGRLLRHGDILLEKSGGGENQPVGCAVLFDQEWTAVCSNFVARLEMKPTAVPRYWTYVFAALYNARVNTKSIKQTSGIQNLDSGQYLSETVFHPPVEEQERIAAFLDRETAALDLMISSAGAVIELLAERRAALISAAVTGQIDVRRMVAA
jgi:type I restriction enzyme S subunit